MRERNQEKDNKLLVLWEDKNAKANQKDQILFRSFISAGLVKVAHAYDLHVEGKKNLAEHSETRKRKVIHSIVSAFTPFSHHFFSTLIETIFLKLWLDFLSNLLMQLLTVLNKNAK